MNIAIGTAQFGRKYGIANKDGVTEQEVFNIIKMAVDNGINCIDTANDYGKSEKLIGVISKQLDTKLNIITKMFLGFSNPQPDDIIPYTEKSLKNLNVDRVYGLLVHNPADLIGEQADTIFNKLSEASNTGLAQKIGVSVATPEQAELITSRYPLDIIQVPCNLLDQRFVKSGLVNQLSDNGLEVHARSIFLQGLFFMETGQLTEYFNDVKPALVKIHNTARLCGVSICRLALEYIKSIKCIDRIIVGVDNSSHLYELIKNYNSSFKHSVDFTEFANDDERFINPGNWNVGGWW